MSLPKTKKEQCPACKSKHIRKNGYQYRGNKTIQRLICWDCKKGFQDVYTKQPFTQKRHRPSRKQVDHLNRPDRPNLSKHPLYRTWCSMIARCRDSSCKVYPHYGGRGIKVCDRWLYSFKIFLEDMGEKPSPRHTLERQNNNGNYDPDNVVWGTWEEQGRNRRNNVFLTLDGERKTVTEWSRLLELPRSTIDMRLERGWSVERALREPLQK